MFKEKKLILSDEFLDDIAKEINQQYGVPTNEQTTDSVDYDEE